MIDPKNKNPQRVAFAISQGVPAQCPFCGAELRDYGQAAMWTCNTTMGKHSVPINLTARLAFDAPRQSKDCMARQTAQLKSKIGELETMLDD